MLNKVEENVRDSFSEVFAELCDNEMFLGIYKEDDFSNDFMLGIATVMSAIARKVSQEHACLYSTVFSGNLNLSIQELERKNARHYFCPKCRRTAGSFTEKRCRYCGADLRYKGEA